EVVVEVSLSDSALTQDVVERGAVIAAQVDEPGRGVEDLISGRRTLWTLGRGRRCRHLSHPNVVPTSRYRWSQTGRTLSNGAVRDEIFRYENVNNFSRSEVRS